MKSAVGIINPITSAQPALVSFTESSGKIIPYVSPLRFTLVYGIKPDLRVFPVFISEHRPHHPIGLPANQQA